MTRDPAESDFTYPLLFLATSGHKPGKTRGHGLHIYNSMRSREIDVKTLIGDRAYFPGARVQDLQGPLAKAGVKIVMDYKTTKLGIQASYTSKDGTISSWRAATGTWHACPSPSSSSNRPIKHDLPPLKSYRKRREALRALKPRRSRRRVGTRAASTT